MFETELDDERAEYQKIIDEQINKLEEFILNDPEFNFCTNKALKDNGLIKINLIEMLSE